MHTQTLSIDELAELLFLEAKRGIIDESALMHLVHANKIPKSVLDIRGAVRLTVDRGENGLQVTEYLTDLAEEKIMDVR